MSIRGIAPPKTEGSMNDFFKIACEIAMLTPAAAAYDQGFHAFVAQLARDTNHYPAWTIEHDAWDRGYADAEAMERPESVFFQPSRG